MKRNEAQQAAHDRLMEDVVRVVQEKRKGTELTYVTEEDFFVARVIGKFSDSGGDDVFDSFFRVFQRMGEGVSREIATFMTVFEGARSHRIPRGQRRDQRRREV